MGLGGPGEPGGRGVGFAFPGFGFLKALGKLDLTEEQELKAIRIRRSLAQEGLALRADAQKDAGELISELEKESPDATRIHGLVEKKLEGMKKLVHSAIDQLLDLHKTLDAQQRKTLFEVAKERHERMLERQNDRGF